VGYTTEVDMDVAKVEETDQQREARAAGHLVKDKSTAISKWRFTWMNHPAVMKKRAAIFEQVEGKRQQTEERAAEKAEYEKRLLQFKSGYTADLSCVTDVQYIDYHFQDEDKDSQCYYCKGFWVTWVVNGLGGKAQKIWKGPDPCEGRDDFYCCTSRECSKQMRAEDKVRKELNALQSPQGGQRKKKQRQAAPAKASAKKASAKKASAKKASAKKVAPKKTSAKKTSAQKAAPKKASAKKDAPKKASAKKGAPKKASAKKDAPKKASAKKGAPKKAAPKKASRK
jgi:hypothetical protein